MRRLLFGRGRNVTDENSVSQNTEEKYEKSWRKLRFLRMVRRVYILSGIIFIIFFIFAQKVDEIKRYKAAVVFFSELNRYKMGFLFFWWTGLIICDSRCLQFRCPRCQDYFFRGIFMRYPSRTSCLHCGLPLWGHDTAPDLRRRQSRIG